MTTAPLRAGVIGCGAIAYEHLPYLATSPRVTLAAVCDRSQGLTNAAADRFGAEARFIDADAMLAAVRLDVVHILTPPQTHDALVRASLAAGAHVVCEKPMTGSRAETDALIDAAAGAGRVLVESRNLLWNDAIIDLQAMIASGRLGRVVECDVILSLDFLGGPFGDTNLQGGIGLPGGAVHDFLPHLVYLFQALTGADAVNAEVRGFLKNRSGNARALYDYLDAVIDDGGVRGRLRVATDAAPAAFGVTVRGTEGTVETDLYNPFRRFDGAPNTGKRAPLGQMAAGWSLIKSGVGNFRAKVMQHGTTHGLPRMLDAVYAALQAGTAPPITPAQMLATAALTDRLLALGEAR